MFLKDGVAKSSSKKLLAVCAVLLLAAVCFSVAIASDESDAADPTITIKNQKMEVNKSYKLEIETNPKDKEYTNPRWDLDDTTGEKAKLDKTTGTITTKSKGTINVTATVTIDSKDVKTTKSFTIIQQVTKVEILEGTTPVSKKDMLLGGEVTFTPNVLPSNADDKRVTWGSTNTSIVKVDNGKVTAVGVGTAAITMTSVYDPELSTSCTIKVTNVPVTGINVSSSATVDVGGNTTITATISPENATNKEIEIANSDSSVINVVSKTLNKNIYTITLKGVKEGKSTITVTTKDGNFKGTCNVTSKPVPVTGVTLNKTELKMEAYGSASQYKLVQTVAPNNATDKTVSWASSDPTVATVDGSGNVTALKPGNASITVTTKDGQHTATCLITVTNELTVEAKITESGGKAVVTNTSDILAGLRAAEEKGLIPTVLIIASNYNQVTIPSEIPRFIKTMDNAQMSVQLKVGYLLFDLGAIERIDTSGSNIGVSMATVDLGEKYEEYKPYYAYDINMYVDEVAKPMSFGSHPVVVILFYQLKEGEKAEDLMVGFIRDSGKPLKVSDAKYDAELGVIFETNHFSKYAFVFHTADFAAGDYSIVLVIISLIVIIVLLILVTLYVRSYEGISGMFSFRKKYDDEYNYQNQY